MFFLKYFHRKITRIKSTELSYRLTKMVTTTSVKATNTKKRAREMDGRTNAIVSSGIFPWVEDIGVLADHVPTAGGVWALGACQICSVVHGSGTRSNQYLVICMAESIKILLYFLNYVGEN